jgi:hypothetical protein
MRLTLFILVSLVALTSTISGMMMINDPDGTLLQLSASLLENTPFENYLLPGILLTGTVGGTAIGAVYMLTTRSVNRYNWSMVCGVVLIGWLIVQMIMIQAAHWLHFVFLAAGVLIILLAYQLKGKWAV